MVEVKENTNGRAERMGDAMGSESFSLRSDEQVRLGSGGTQECWVV